MDDDLTDSPDTSVDADHPGTTGPRRLYLAPTRDGEFHRIRERLHALACWRMSHALFAFDSSLVLPAAQQDFARLAARLDQHPGALLSVFGHADPTGDDGYNKTLSGRRARAVFALLVRDTDIWEELYGKAMPGDTWGTRSLQTMLTRVTPPDGGDPYLAGSPSGFADGPTTKATKAFQHDHDLPSDGVAGPKTRAVLFRAYMDALAVGPSRQLVLDRSQFVGRGEDAGDKGAVQGCSEFNPVFLLSQAENAAYVKTADHTERDAKNAPNRRVMVLLFAPDAPVTAASWPCPRWNESTAGCKTEFWPDGEERRTAGEEEREYKTDQRTMACRWYDRFVRLSPCEGSAPRGQRLTLLRLTDASRQPISSAPVRIRTLAGIIQMKADDAGWITLQGRRERVHVEWTLPEYGDEETYPYGRHVFLNVEDSEEGDDERLFNLGFEEGNREANVRAYQRNFSLPVTGRLIDIQGSLRTFHDGGDKPENG